MKLILFSKSFKDKSIEELINLAHDFNFDGYDLCVRPDYPVNPDNASEKLPETVKLLNKEELSIPMVTGNFDLLYPDHFPSTVSLRYLRSNSPIRSSGKSYFLGRSCFEMKAA